MHPDLLLKTLAAATAMAAVVVIMQGCAIERHHGIEVSEEQARSFKVGVSTRDDVIASLGKPSWSATRPTGERVIGYVRSTSRINPPSAGTLIGTEPKVEFVGMQTTMFVFDGDSKLLRIERPAEKGRSDGNG